MQTHFNIPGASPLLHVGAVDGWRLWSYEEWDGDGFACWAYFARKYGESDVKLDTSRFRFSPTTERFTFFVRNDFPRRDRQHEWLGGRPSGIGPWDDTEIDEAISRERIAA